MIINYVAEIVEKVKLPQMIPSVFVRPQIYTDYTNLYINHQLAFELE